MKINYDAPLQSLNAQPIQDENGKPVTLKDVVLISLQMQSRDPDPVEKKSRIFGILLKAYAGGTQDVTPEDVTLIKEKIGEVQPPLVMGRCFELLNG